MKTLWTKTCVLMLHQWLENCYYGTLQNCYYGNKKKNSKRVSKETATKPGKYRERPNALFRAYVCTDFFLPGKGPPNTWEGMLLSFGVLVSWTGGQNGLKLGEEECWVFARRILKVRKEERGGDSHPAGCFSCHSKKSQAKFGAYSEKKRKKEKKL